MTNPCRISVVIPTYQRCESVRRVLETIAQQTFPPDEYEVIVSIDGSEDGTREMTERFSAPYPLRTLWQPNRGRAAACNAGIRTAIGELIVLLDDDMEPVPGFLAAHWRAHLRDDHLGVLGAVPIRVDASLPPVSTYIADKFNRHLALLAQPGHQFKLRDFYSGNFSIHRERLFEIGLFDESFKIYGNEDLELFLRLSKQNVRVTFCPDALAYQSNTKDFAALARDRISEGQTAVLFVLKHRDQMPNTKLGTYHHFSFKWRMLRAGLVKLSSSVSALPSWIMRWVMHLEKLRLAGLTTVYYLTLDYFYWLGVSYALRASADKHLLSSIKTLQKSSRNE